MGITHQRGQARPRPPPGPGCRGTALCPFAATREPDLLRCPPPDASHLRQRLLGAIRLSHPFRRTVRVPRRVSPACRRREAVGDFLQTLPHWLESDRHNRSRDDGEQQVGLAGSADQRPDPDHDAYVHGRDERRQRPIDEGPANDKVDVVKPVLQDRQRCAGRNRNPESQQDREGGPPPAHLRLHESCDGHRRVGVQPWRPRRRRTTLTCWRSSPRDRRSRTKSEIADARRASKPTRKPTNQTGPRGRHPGPERRSACTPVRHRWPGDLVSIARDSREHGVGNRDRSYDPSTAARPGARWEWEHQNRTSLGRVDKSRHPVGEPGRPDAAWPGARLNDERVDGVILAAMPGHRWRWRLRGRVGPMTLRRTPM